jgi:outer membrane immunogenic protein
MRMGLLIGTAIAALVGGSALAADIPLKAPPRAVTYNWSGIYIGGVASYGFAKAEHCSVIVPCAPSFPFTDMTGWLGGGTVGANYQINNFVLGVEADWSGGKLNGSSPSTTGFGCAGLCANSIRDVATVRGRIGWAYDRVLVYGTAGGAWERLQASIGTPPVIDNRTTRSNFVYGGGAEFALGGNVSAKLEFLRTTKLGTFVEDTNRICTAICTLEVKELNLLRVGLNWRFPAFGY